MKKYTFSLCILLSGCQGLVHIPNNFNTKSQPFLSFNVASTIPQGPCVPITIDVLSSTAQPMAAYMNIPVALTTIGSGSFFSSFQNCAASAGALSSTTIPIGSTQITLFYKDLLVENIELVAQDTSGNFAPASVSLSVTAQNFNRAQGFDSQIYAITPTTYPSLSGGGSYSGYFYIGGSFNNFYTLSQSYATSKVARMNIDGSLDTSFISQTMNNTVYTIASSNDGSNNLYVGGAFSTFGGVSMGGIVGLTSTGAINTNFNVGSGFNGTVNSIVLTDDVPYKILVGGNFTSYNGTPANYIIRLTQTGAVDTTFGTGMNGPVSQIMMNSDGSNSFYVNGNFTTFNGATTNALLIRVLPGGIQDSAFNASGVFSTYGSTVGYLTNFPNDSSNRIYYCAGMGYYLRLLSSGSIDTSIPVLSNGNWGSTSLFAVDSLGNIYGNAGNGGLSLEMSNPSGVMQWGFPSSQQNHISAISLYPDGSNSLLVSQYRSLDNMGYSPMTSSSHTYMNLAGLDNSGNLLPGFNLQKVPSAEYGVAVSSWGFCVFPHTDPYNPDAVIASESIVPFSYYIFSANGDSATLLQGLSANPNYLSCAFTSDGSGKFYVYSRGTQKLYRYFSTGILDSSFPTLTVTWSDSFYGPGYNNPSRHTITIDNQQSVYFLSGAFTSITKYLSTGIADPSFSGSVAGGQIMAILATLDGSGIYVAGTFTSYNGTAVSSGLVRITQTGALDTTFTPPTIGSSCGDLPISEIDLAEDGTNGIYVSGSMESINGMSVLISSGITAGLAKLLSNGSLNTTFNPLTNPSFQGHVLNQGLCNNKYASQLATALDGSNTIYVWYYGSQLVRFLADGGVDQSFDATSGMISTEIQYFLPLSDGSGRLYGATGALYVLTGPLSNGTPQLLTGGVFRFWPSSGKIN